MFYDIFLSLCNDKGIRPGKAANEMGINRSNVTSWKNSGYTPRGETLKRIAEYFDVSESYLLGSDSAETQKTPALTSKDERDIAKELERLRTNLETCDGLMFDGNPLSDEARESILAAMKIGLEMAKTKNKETYTPKKYRKDIGNE